MSKQKKKTLQVRKLKGKFIKCGFKCFKFPKLAKLEDFDRIFFQAVSVVLKSEAQRLW